MSPFDWRLSPFRNVAETVGNEAKLDVHLMGPVDDYNEPVAYSITLLYFTSVGGFNHLIIAVNAVIASIRSNVISV